MGLLKTTQVARAAAIFFWKTRLQGYYRLKLVVLISRSANEYNGREGLLG